MQLKTLPRKVKKRASDQLNILSTQIEWTLKKSVLRQEVWCQNRLNQRYRPISFPEFKYMRKGNPEVNVSLLLQKLLKPGMTVFDIGANHGLFTMEAAYFVGSHGSVYAFEPTPNLCQLIRQHLDINNIKNVELLELAVGSSKRTSALRVHHHHTGLNSLASQDLVWQGKVLPADEVIEVSVETLDSVVSLYNIEHIDVLKVDVEGYELDVLLGATETLSQKRIGYIFIEIADLHEINSKLSVDELLSLMKTMGYSIFSITEHGEMGTQIHNKSDLVGAEYNFICTYLPQNGKPQRETKNT